MLGYSIMLSMAKKYGFRTFLDEVALLNLERYFQNIRNVSKLESLCFTEYPWIDYLQSPQNLALDKTLSVGHAIQYCKEVNFSHISSLSDISLKTRYKGFQFWLDNDYYFQS